MIDLFPLDLSIELYLASDWREFISYRRAGTPINITAGRKDEISDAVPTECALTFDDRDNSLSPDNPVGPYYGSLDRNTPLRITNNIANDSFGRTVSGGWGTTDTGDAWSVVGTAANYSVASGVGKHSVARGTACTSYLAGVTFLNVDMVIDVTLPFSNVTGNIVWPANFVLRGQDSANYILAGVLIETTEVVTIELYDVVAGAYVFLDNASIDVPGLTFSGQTLSVRAQVEDETVRVKVWPASAAEPYAWHLSGRTENFHTAGWVGVQSSVDAANTNTTPVVFSYDNLTVRLPIFAGEVAAWPTNWDLSGEDITVAITAAGIRRRLSQGASPLDSTLKRGNVALLPLAQAYWPCEDGKDATTLASALGGPAMSMTGDTDMASYADFKASNALPVTKAGSWSGDVPPYTATGEVQLRWVMHAPSTEIVNLGLIAQLQTTGTSGNWEVKYRTGGGLSLEVWSGGTQLFDSGAIAFTVLDVDVMVSLELTQNGSNVDWKLATLQVGDTDGGVVSNTLNSRTLGNAKRVIITPYREVEGLALGHVAVRSEITSLFDLAQELNAFAGELAAARLQRLCDQEGITLALAGDPDGTAAMGPQKPMTLLDLLDECADADLGTLYEPRGDIGLAYRAGSSLYNQDPVFTLDYSGAQVSDPFQPVRDDQFTRNDITVSRVDGGSYRAVLSAGPMSVLPPDQGGVGRYADTPSVNVADDDQLASVASWLLHLGTVRDTRYPEVGVDLRNVHVTEDAALTRAVRDLGVDNRFIIENPKPGQAPDDLSLLARGYLLVLDIFQYSLTLNAAPENSYHVPMVGDGTAIIDSDSSTLTNDYTSTATSLSVTVVGTGLWTRTASDFPFDIRILGEVLTVTNITGTSSPQTFTVTRSVNGVVKALTAGAPVKLAYPTYIGVS